VKRLVWIAVAAALLGPGVASGRPAPARLQVSADEFSFAESRAQVRAGVVIIQLVNYGEDDHDLAVRGVGRSRVHRMGIVHPGGARDIELRLAPGRYILWCTLPGHRARGMEAGLRVK
jgi:hypothetical protein